MQLGEVAVERPQVAALDEDVGVAAEDDGAEAVPLRLEQEVARVGQRLGQLGQHRLDRRRDGGAGEAGDAGSRASAIDLRRRATAGTVDPRSCCALASCSSSGSVCSSERQRVGDALAVDGLAGRARSPAGLRRGGSRASRRRSATSPPATCSADRRGDGAPGAGDPSGCCRASSRSSPSRAGPAWREPRAELGRRARRRSSGRCGVPPRRITWQVSLPVVWKIADTPCLVTDGNQCGERADSTASTAVCVLPSVPFLNPTGIDSPDASSRCTWLSVVRAPIATHDVRSAMCCGICVSRNSDAGRQAHVVDVEQQLARQAQALVDVEALVEVGIVDEPLPADRRARLLEVAAHHDDQVVRVARRPARCSRLAYSSAAFGVVDRAGPGDDDEPRIAALDGVGDGRAGVGDDVRGPLADRDFLEQDGRRNQRPDVGDAEVVGAAEHHPSGYLGPRRDERLEPASGAASRAGDVQRTAGP